MSKLIHMHQKKTDPEGTSLWEQGQAAEKAGDIDAAIAAYESLLKEKKLDEQVYLRLMILFRKTQQYKKELKIIDAGIKAFENAAKPPTTKRNRTIISLSRKLGLLTGLMDKKGKHLHDPEPIATWKKRREVVRRKIR